MFITGLRRSVNGVKRGTLIPEDEGRNTAFIDLSLLVADGVNC